MNKRSYVSATLPVFLLMIGSSPWIDPFPHFDQEFFAMVSLLPVFQLLIPLLLVVLAFMLGLIFERNRAKLKNKPFLHEVTDKNLNAENEPVNESGNPVTEHELRMLNATKDKFFSIIAHDLKNPFNSLLGFSDLLKNDFDNYETEDIKRFISIIHESSKHGFDLLENLLQWSRSQTCTIAFLPDILNLKNIIKGCVDLLQSTADKKEISMYTDIPADIEIHGDIEMLSTVFRNLISNAIKFTPPNGRIKIKARRLSKTVEVSVIDTGVGIPEEKIPDLFRIDKQVSTYGTGNEKGTGLGLILCKEFVDKHKGKIKVSSERKNGSEFKVLLPAQIKKQDGNAGKQTAKKAIEKREYTAHP